MIVTLDEAKIYLRVDTSDEDDIITLLIDAAQRLCMDVARIDDEETFNAIGGIAKIAVLYTLAFYYENRDGDADYHSLTLKLRALLHGVRREIF